MAGQITGLKAVMEALENGVAIDRVLVDRDHDTSALRALCEAAGIPFEEGSTNDLWRMSADGAQVALALTGRTQHETLDEVMKAGGCIWFFDGVEYSTNLGFAIRTAEVSGANAVVLNVAKTHEERRTIRRASMRADRFIPVVYSDTNAILQSAKDHGVRLIAAEDVGEAGPWDEDLTGECHAGGWSRARRREPGGVGSSGRCGETSHGRFCPVVQPSSGGQRVGCGSPSSAGISGKLN